MKTSETIRILEGSSLDSDSWEPRPGSETRSFLDRKFNSNQRAKDKVLRETINILKLCGNPKISNNNDTGLVVGYIQSGKTLNFTAVTTLARDNGYRLIIVIAGISNHLVDQSYTRLERDLAIEGSFFRKWLLIKNPKLRSKDFSSIDSKLESKPYSEDFGIENQTTVIVVVMKNSTHLKNLNNVISKLDLEGIPTIIVDDEGDQASLNTKANKNAKDFEEMTSLSPLKMSTIYSRIDRLKSLIPNHTFLQYTATPQAPLFIHLLDNLSPRFVQILDPGEKYTGGKEFFVEYDDQLIEQIPSRDIVSDENHINEIPNSLKKAMRIYFIGVAAGLIIGDKPDNPKNRSMMVHPSRLIKYQKIYTSWINMIKGQWERILKRKKLDDSKLDLIEEFKKSYEDLKGTVDDIPNFDRIKKFLLHAISNTAIQEINSTEDGVVDWKNDYSSILIGGQTLDRGFTVEGLTVTYMPRSVGISNADTIQQRARFYGYKKDYLGYCRVFLDVDGIHLFSKYVDHEEDLRNRLKLLTDENNCLIHFERKVVLDELLNLTRKNVLSNKLVRNRQKPTWFSTKAPHDNIKNAEYNLHLFKTFYKKYQHKFSEDQGHELRTSEQIHLVGTFEIDDLYNSLISELRFTRGNDSFGFTNTKSILLAYPKEKCDVYIMRKGNSRIRKLNTEKEIPNLFQGKNPESGEIIYPGDREIIGKKLASIQLHLLRIKDNDFKYDENVLALAAWFPKRMYGESTIEMIP